jgi:isoquinoline 1-oxidoreductase subunit beta
MEPLNTTVHFTGDKAEVWAGSQIPGVDRMAVAQTLGLQPEQVTFHTEMAGGGFGRRAVLDSHVQREAAAVARHLKGTPVKLIWTREDDVEGGYYRPMCLHRVEIGVGGDGMPAAWRHVVVCQSLLAGTPFERKGGSVDDTVVEGVADTPYAVPNFWIAIPPPGASRSAVNRYVVQGMLMGSFRRILLHVLPCRIAPELSNTKFPDSKIEVAA